MNPANVLVSGPRGRHLLLDLIGDAVAATAGPGERTPLDRLLGNLASEIYDADGSLSFLDGDFRAGKLAGLLRHAPPVDTADLPLMRAVVNSVENAVYWQPREEEDVLLTLPVFREALAPAAARVADAPIMDWWASGFAPQCQVWPQFVNRDDVPRPRPASLAPKSGALAAWRGKILADEVRFRGDREIHGDWWSAPALAAPSTTRALPTHGASGLWWMEDSFGWRHAELFAVDVDRDTRVFEIGSAADWISLCRDYPLEVTWGMQNTWHACTGRHGKWLIPDWSQVSRDFDAVHLSVLGYLGTAGGGARPRRRLRHATRRLGPGRNLLAGRNVPTLGGIGELAPAERGQPVGVGEGEAAGLAGLTGRRPRAGQDPELVAVVEQTTRGIDDGSLDVSPGPWAPDRGGRRLSQRRAGTAPEGVKQR